MYLIIVFVFRFKFSRFFFYFFFFSGSNFPCPKPLRRWPRGRARPAPTLPISFCALFTNNFELFSNSRLGANAPRHAPARLTPRLRKSRLEHSAESRTKKNAKILKNLLLTQMAQPVVSVKNLFLLSDCAIKKEIP